MGTSLKPVDMLIPGGNLESYMRTVNSIPILSVEEERELSSRLHDENDLLAARHLIMSHLRLSCILQRAIPVTDSLRLT